MLTLIITLSLRIYRITRYLPGNLLRAYLRQRSKLKYGLIGCVIAAPYFWFALWFGDLVRTENHNRGLLLIAVSFGWSAILFFIEGIRSPARLLAARYREMRARSQASRITTQ